MEFNAFEYKFDPFKQHSKHWNANLTHSNGIWTIPIQIRMGFEAFKCKFKPFERHSKHSNANSTHSNGIRSIRMQIRTIRMEFKALVCKFKPFDGIWSIQMQIPTIRTGFETFKCKPEPLKRDSKHSNANLNHSCWPMQQSQHFSASKMAELMAYFVVESFRTVKNKTELSHSLHIGENIGYICKFLQSVLMPVQQVLFILTKGSLCSIHEQLYVNPADLCTHCT